MPQPKRWGLFPLLICCVIESPVAPHASRKNALSLSLSLAPLPLSPSLSLTPTPREVVEWSAMHARAVSYTFCLYSHEKCTLALGF